MQWPVYIEGFIYRETNFGSKWRTDIDFTMNEQVDFIPEQKPVFFGDEAVRVQNDCLYIGNKFYWIKRRAGQEHASIFSLSSFGSYLTFEMLERTFILDPVSSEIFATNKRLVTTPKGLFTFDGWVFSPYDLGPALDTFNFATIGKIHAS